MATETRFDGFPKDALRFLAELKKNNKREWFEANRARYEASLLEPSRAFVTAMGKRLLGISPFIRAEPKVNRSLFRINRDTRFSKDKSPYKTHVGILFWEGARKRMACSSFYFHLEAQRLMVGVGIYMLPKELLEPYRQAVVDEKRGPALHRVIQKLGGLTFGRTGCGLPVDRYKRVPRGFDADHRFADYLKFKGLHAGVEDSIPKELHSPAILDYCMERFEQMAPLHHWIVETLG